MRDDPNDALVASLSAPESQRFDAKAERRASEIGRQGASESDGEKAAVKPRKFQKGDIGGTRGTAWLSRAIRWATRQCWEPKSVVNHTFLVVNNCDRIEDVEIVEALARVRHHKLHKRYVGKGEVEIWRPLNVDTEQRARIAARALEFVGRWYPWHRLLLHLVDEKIFSGRVVMRRLAVVESWAVCTPLAMLAYWPENLHFGLESPFEGNPDNLRDFLVENRDKYENFFPLQQIKRGSG